MTSTLQAKMLRKETWDFPGAFALKMGTSSQVLGILNNGSSFFIIFFPGPLEPVMATILEGSATASKPCSTPLWQKKTVHPRKLMSGTWSHKWKGKIHPNPNRQYGNSKGQKMVDRCSICHFKAAGLTGRRNTLPTTICRYSMCICIIFYLYNHHGIEGIRKSTTPYIAGNCTSYLCFRKS